MILASDYDGTLHVDEEQTLKNLAAVAEWRKKGHQFGLITGRSYGRAHVFPSTNTTCLWIF